MPLIPSPEAAPIPPGAEGWCGWDVDPALLCPDWDTYSTAQKDLALNTAVTVMWAATGRQYGPCLLTIRPCQSEWIAEQYMAFPVWWTGQPYSGPYPFLFGGEWFNTCGCGPRCCCRPRCEIILPGPVFSVHEVVVSGQVLQPYEYRVDLAQGQYRLVKMSPGCWPTCQDLNQYGTGPNAFQVSITRGNEVPGSVLGATAMLACELGKQIVGAACALPPRMQSLTRQGVSAEFIVSEIDVNTFQTGINSVDMVIRAVNPSRRTRPPMVFSPDLPQNGDRRTVIGG